MTYSKRLLAAMVFVCPVATLAQGPKTVTVSPSQSVQAVVSANAPGTRYVFTPGTYRLAQIQPKTGDQYIAEPGTILSGAVSLQSFSRSGKYYVATNQMQQGQLNGQCASTRPMCQHPEDLFFDNKPLIAVGSLAQVVPGTWFFDYGKHAIYFVDNPAGHVVETSVARAAFSGSANSVTIVGFTIEKYAIPAQMGAIGDQYPGTDWNVALNEIRLNHGRGITGSSGWDIDSNYVHDNGQMGIGATGNYIHVQNNEISYNNYAGFDSGWEAGGAKFAMATNLVVRANRSHDNGGCGLWTDIDSANVVYDSNISYNNQGPGIQHEISWAATISNNTVYNNGSGDFAWLNGGQIEIMNSSHVEVVGNMVNVASGFGNAIAMESQNRGSGPNGVYLLQHNLVHKNDITYQPGSNAYTGVATDYDASQVFAAGNNIFDYNTYHVSNPGTYNWAFNGPQNWSGFLGQGQETHGTIDAAIKPMPKT